MSLSRIAGITVAALIAVTPSAFAQTPPKTKTDVKKATQTFTGCLMSDADYRRAHNLGAGSRSEFVLVDAQVSPAQEMAPAASLPNAPRGAPASSGTCTDQGLAYRLRGAAANSLKGLAGHQVAIEGRFEHADDVTAAGTQKPDEKLPPELDVVSLHEAPAPTAAAPVPEPAVPTPPQPQASTVPPVPAPSTPAPTALPHSASPSGSLALIAMLALSSGIVLTAVRRRRV
jgi:hypothetical protein